MQGFPPQEVLPSIGTVENPALFYDGKDLLLCYELASSDGSGTAVLLFSDVIYFEKNSVNLPESGRYLRYPACAWQFTEVFDSDRTERWKALKTRFWTISFADVMVEVVFREVRLLHRNLEANPPQVALLNYLKT